MMPPLMTVGSLAAGVEQRGDHRGGGGFAVGAADGDGPFQPHDLGQHFRAPHDGHAARARGVDFGIAVLDGGGNHHHARMRRVLGLVADEHLYALRAQPLGIGAFLGVGARSPRSRDSSSPRRCRTCRCRRCRRNGWARCRKEWRGGSWGPRFEARRIGALRGASKAQANQRASARKRRRGPSMPTSANT